MNHLGILALAFSALACGSAEGDVFGGPGSSGGFVGNPGGASSTGGSVLGETGGRAATGGAPSTGGTTSTGGATATGGAAPTTGGASTGGRAATGGVLSIGGTVATGGASPTTGGSSTGGSVSTGGAATGGAATGGKPSTCEAPDPARTYKMGEVIATSTSARMACTQKTCTAAERSTSGVWLPTSCDATCATCARGCDAPQLLVLGSGSSKTFYSSHPDYVAAVETGWEVRLQPADGCAVTGVDDGQNCLYLSNHKLARCTGSTEDCRRYDPRWEHCSPASLAGNAFPCRDVSTRPTSPWTIVGDCAFGG